MAHEDILYQHVKRPEWGFSTIINMEDDRTTFVFDDGARRTITIGHMHLMERVVLEDEAEEEVRQKLAKYKPSSTLGGATKRKRAPKKKKPATAAQG
jgi:hypothetical protein